MPDGEPPVPNTAKAANDEMLTAVEVPAPALPLVVVDQPTGNFYLEVELARLRHEQEVALASLRRQESERAHERKRELIDRVAGHILRSMVLVGGIVLFLLHYPLFGALLLGAGLDVLTKSELRDILLGAIHGVVNRKPRGKKRN